MFAHRLFVIPVVYVSCWRDVAYQQIGFRADYVHLGAVAVGLLSLV